MLDFNIFMHIMTASLFNSWLLNLRCLVYNHYSSKDLFGVSKGLESKEHKPNYFVFCC